MNDDALIEVMEKAFIAELIAQKGVYIGDGYSEDETTIDGQINLKALFRAILAVARPVIEEQTRERRDKTGRGPCKRRALCPASPSPNSS